MAAFWGLSAIDTAEDRQFVAGAVDLVLAELGEPDRDMVEDGRAEIERALPPGTAKGYQRQLCRVIWRAMVARVP